MYNKEIRNLFQVSDHIVEFEKQTKAYRALKSSPLVCITNADGYETTNYSNQYVNSVISMNFQCERQTSMHIPLNQLKAHTRPTLYKVTTFANRGHFDVQRRKYQFI